MTSYKILWDNSYTGLEVKVSAYMENGYLPAGGIHEDSTGHLLQAVYHP